MCTLVKIYFSKLYQPKGWLTKHAAKSYLLAIALIASISASAQIGITTNSNAQALSQLLAGQGVTISNYTRTCDANGSATFTNNATNLGLTQGVVLATGRATNVPNAANNFASNQFTTNSDAQLATLTSGNIYDKCILEFDIIPQGNYLKFDYVFASEEYPEFVCSQFNDVFGFFISGANPGGGNYTNFNIATIPNTTLPVCINAINPGVSGTYNGTTWNSNNCVALNQTSFYTNNLAPLNPQIIYDGMTKKMTAIAAVTPCQTYHLKLAIADVGDRIYDSGVFLEAYSFTSAGITVSASGQLDYAGYTSAYEGCVGGTFRVSMPAAQPADLYVDVVVTGTAANGVDYTNIPTTVVIPAGQTYVNIDLNPLQDALAESPESVTVAVVNPCTGLPTSSATLMISDNIPLIATAADTTLCRGQSTQLTATGGATYTWSPATGLSNPNIANPVATPTATTTYIVAGTWGACTKYDTITIHVSNLATMLSSSPSDTMCTGSTLQISASTTGGLSPYTYIWSTGSTASNITVAAGGAYRVTITDAETCTVSAVKNVYISNPTVSVTTTSTTCNGNTGTATTTLSGANVPATYLWNDGNTQANRTGLSAGSYTVTITDANGCTASASVTVGSNFPTINISLTANNVSCFAGNNGTINTTISGGTAAYTYNWGGGTTTANRTNLSAGTYSLTVTDANSCSATASTIITQPAAALSVSLASGNVNCFGANMGTITTTVTGGTTAYTYNWGGGVTTATRTNLVAGTYNLTVTDANGCSATASTIITQPAAALAVSLAKNNVSCFAGSNGTITTAVIGGTSAYTYNWGAGVTTANRTNLNAGTYNLTVTDANSCSATASIIITQPAAALAVSLVSGNVSCYAGSNGTIATTVTGGTTAYTYNWGGGVTTANRTGLVAGTYNLTVTDVNGCSATASTTITQPAAALAVSLATNNVSCFSGNNGTITTTISGGTSAYTYNWGGGVTTANRTGLVAGTYNLTVADANACSATASTIITQPAAALAVTLAKNNVSCFASSNGTITTAVIGGTAAYTYNWGAGITTANRTNLSAGTYNLTVTDANGCSASGSSTITQPAAALSVSLTSNNVSCFSGNNGTITTSVTGGTTAYTYNWGGGVTTANRTNLSAGAYNLTVTDANGCSATASAVVTQPAAALAVSLTKNNVSCFVGSNGTITTTVIGGTTAYTYNWGGGIIIANRTNLSAGSYNLTVTDANGCSATASAVVTQPAAALAVSLTKNNVSCFVGSNGTITTTVIGGTTAYTYNWGGGITTANRTGLNAGTYTLTVTDANACSATASSTITQPASALAVSLAKNNVNCFAGSNGTITTTVTGGTSAYTYNWGGGVTTANRTGLTAGTYNLTVTDANGCSAIASSTITQPAAALSVSLASNNVNCFAGSNGTVTTTVTGGTTAYAYNWGGGVATANRTNLNAGTYGLTVTDANACSATASTIITQPTTALSVSLLSANVNCFGANTGTITTTVIGGTTAYTYNWGGGITTANPTNLSAGTYNLTVTDANACSVTASTTIAQPVTALAVSLAKNNVNCFAGSNGTITTTVTGGTSAYTYNWGGGVTTANRTGLVAGTYNLTVTDVNGCSASASSTITQPAAALAVTLSKSNVSCFGGNNATITTTVIGGTTAYTYNWGGGVTTANRTNLSAGTYNLTVTDANGCSASASSTITQPAAALAVALASNNVSCFGGNNGTITTAVTGGTTAYSYNWSGGITTANRTGLTAGTYNLTVTDANGCSASASSTITQPAAALAVTLSKSNVSCFGGNNATITTTVIGGTTAYTYNWGGGITTANRSNLNAGTYNLSVTDANSCSATVSIIITQPAAALAVSLVSGNVSCYAGSNGTIATIVTGGTTAYSYNWSGGITTANRTNLNAGTYNLTVTDANSCSATASIIITQPAAALAVSLVSGNVSCYAGSNGTIATTVTGGTTAYTYNWGGGVTTANRTGLVAGTYNLTVTDVNGCSASANTVITQPTAALAISLATNNVSCFSGNNGTITTTVTGGTTAYTYNWGGGVTTANRTGLVAGTYNLTVTDANGCSTSASIVVNQPTAALAVSLAKNNVSCFAGSNGTITTTVTGGTTAYTYNWGAGVTTANRTNLNAGTYNLTVIDANTCSATASAIIAQPAAALAVSLANNNVSCFAGSNGTITTAVTGGTTAYSYSWSGGITTANRTNLNAGTYNLTVADANGCSANASTVITQPILLTAIASSTNLSCNNANDGSIAVTALGGTMPYAYTWSHDNQYTSNFCTSSPAGYYAVSVTDANNCSTTVSTTLIQPAILNISATSSNVSCANGSNANITTSVSGGTAAYNYLWNDNVTTPNRAALSIGAYKVIVSDTKGCQDSASVIITQPSQIQIAATTTNVSCFGGNNGAIASQVNGGTGSYTYLWSNTSTQSAISNLVANTYTLTVTDANNCTSAFTSTITQPTQLTATTTKTDVACNNGNTGSITVSANGGIAPYAFVWSHSNTLTNNIGMSLPAGYYNVSITDANQCSTTISSTITQPTVLSISATANNVLCTDGNNGSINTQVSGGAGNYTYLWNDNVTTANRSSMRAGTYAVTVTDENGCNNTTVASITQPDSIKTTIQASNVSCNNGNNGTITVSVTGGITPYTYSWSHNQQLNTNTGVSLPAGYYNVSVKDANNCSTSAGADITQPFALSATATQTNVSCNNGNDGAISVYANGGTAPYTYSWSHNNQLTTNTSTTLPAGYFNTSVTDANNCSITIGKTITQPAAITAAASVTDVTCFGSSNGSVSLNVAGGTAPYTYGWGNGQQNSISNSGTLPAGYYTVSITDDNGCNSALNYTIAQPAAIALTVSSVAVTCPGGNNGTVSTTCTGGTLPYTFRWSNNSNTPQVQNLIAGAYIVTVTDNQQCTAHANVQVAQPNPIAIALTHTDISCDNNTSGSVNTNVSGGTAPYNYTWSNGQTSQNMIGLHTGNYTLTVTDANNCTSGSSAAIVPTATLPVTAAPVNVTCHGLNNGKVNIAISGGIGPYIYHWNTGAAQQNLQALAVGVYTVTVTDQNSCSGTATANVVQPTPLDVAALPVNVQCFGVSNGSVTVVAQGGTQPYRYDWDDINGNNDPPVRTNVTIGTYKVTVIDSNQCMANAIAAITAPMPLSLNLALHNPACYGDSSGGVAMSTTGGTTPYNYNWSNNTNHENLSHVPAGSYGVNVTDDNGCSVSASVTLHNPAQLLVSATHTNTSCFGGSDGVIEVSAAGGATPYTYHWNDNANQANRPNVAAGMYIVTVTDVNGCQKQLSVPVSQPQAITVIQQVNNIACHGESNGSITLITNGGNAPYTYAWNNDESTNSLSALQPGTYHVTITDNNNCTNSASYQITQPLTALQTSIESINNACFNQYNGSVNVLAEGGTQPYTYHWNTGATHSTLNNLNAGYYEVTITDANGCIIENSAPIIELPELKSEVLISNPACKTGHGSIDVTINAGASPYAFNWSTGNTNEDINPAPIGNYSLTITDANGCTYKEQYRVEEDLLNPFTINAGEDTTVKLGETVILNGTTNAFPEVSMVWSLPAGLSCTECSTTFARPVRTTTYTVSATDENGCVASDEVTINITAWGTVFIPNAFSPNGDGNNDSWEIFGSSEIWEKVEIIIFNRWGEKMFETNDINGRWDGMFKGEPAPQAVYVYVADITYIDGRREADLKGSLTLVR